MFHVVLYEPEIPPNTGNIMRLCANTGTHLHLIHPLGFQLEEKSLRRAGLDYRDWADVQEHASLDACLESVKPSRWFAISTKGRASYAGVQYQENDMFVFGPETRGLPAELLASMPVEQVLRLPMVEDSRSINLANAVSVVVYEAWRQLDFTGAV